MHHRTAAIAFCCTLALGLALPASAGNPEREAAGWKKWADFTANVAANVGEGSYNANGVKAACKGVTGMTISQGFQFPYWGQSVIQACQVYDEVGDFNEFFSVGNDQRKKIRKRMQKNVCKQAERVAENLGKATPIASEPRAQQLAFDLAESMGRIYDAAECSGKKRTWAWRHEEHAIKP
jgi:hypothetical protein